MPESQIWRKGGMLHLFTLSEDVFRPLSALRCLPVDVLVRNLDVASLAVDAAGQC